MDVSSGEDVNVKLQFSNDNITRLNSVPVHYHAQEHTRRISLPDWHGEHELVRR